MTVARFTSEQVDAALDWADRYGHPSRTRVLAAEVRAQRVELAEIREAAEEDSDMPHEDLLRQIRRFVEIDDERYRDRHRR